VSSKSYYPKGAGLMKQQWDVDELIEQFTLLPPEIEWLGENEEHNHLGKAISLKFFQ
jgi:hypothetical protein